MRNFLVLAMSCLACLSAEANEWQQFTPTSYVLRPNEGDKILIMASLKGDSIFMSILDATGTMCSEHETRDAGPAGPYKVNEQNIKFNAICVNGNRVAFPSTDKGMRFFNKSVTSDSFTLVLDRGTVLHFEGEGFERAKKAMIDTNSAL